MRAIGPIIVEEGEVVKFPDEDQIITDYQKTWNDLEASDLEGKDFLNWLLKDELSK